jgi:hypothetical protein
MAHYEYFGPVANPDGTPTLESYEIMQGHRVNALRGDLQWYRTDGYPSWYTDEQIVDETVARFIWNAEDARIVRMIIAKEDK